MKPSYLTRRESIILSAIEIIDELGIQGLSTREIAHRQEISDAALYRHFKSKDDIILAVLDYFSSFDHSIYKTIKNNNLSPKEGIIFYLSFLAEYYENYPAITAIVLSYEALIYDQAAAEKVKEIMNGRLKYLYEMIQESKEINEIKCNVENEDLAYMLIGFMRSIIFEWRLQNYGFSLKERVSGAIESFLKIC